MWTLAAAIWFLYTIVAAGAADVIEFTIPSAILDNVSQIINPHFAGFGIEFSNVYSFTGTPENPNTFSLNLLSNIQAVTGVGPCIRVGGNTQDYAVYNNSFTDAVIGKNPNPTLEPGLPDYYPFDGLIYGPELFKALNKFPAGTQFIFGLNLAYNHPDYLEKITTTASAALSALNDKLYSFEIGNEPDLYDSTAPYRVTELWDGSTYATEWVTRASAIQSQVSPLFFLSNHRYWLGLGVQTIHSRQERLHPLSEILSRSNCSRQTISTVRTLYFTTTNTTTSTISASLATQSRDRL